MDLAWRGVRRVWRYQRGNHNPEIEGQTIQWQKDKRTKGQTTIYKALHRNLKTEQHSSAPEGKTIPAPLVAPVVFVSMLSIFAKPSTNSVGSNLTEELTEIQNNCQLKILV